MYAGNCYLKTSAHELVPENNHSTHFTFAQNCADKDTHKRVTILYIADEVLGDDLPQTSVEFLSMFTDHHGVGTPVKLFKAQQAIVLILNGLEGILKDLPDALCIPLI